METLVVAHHRNGHHQYYGRSRGHGSPKDGYFSSPPSANFRAINCRSFESGSGLLPVPFSDSTSVNRREFRTPKSISPCLTEKRKGSTSILNYRSVPVPIKIKFEELQEEMFFSERWAGPAYSNSPPPSSLPIPRFSFPPKRTSSLELPSLVCKIDLGSMANSAPTSPVRDRSPSPVNAFDFSDSATRTLRRILNLDIADE